MAQRVTQEGATTAAATGPQCPGWASEIIVNQAAMQDCSEFQQPARANNLEANGA
jgi:hypothetical protein